jgi:hypothetical protein
MRWRETLYTNLRGSQKEGIGAQKPDAFGEVALLRNDSSTSHSPNLFLPAPLLNNDCSFSLVQ